MEVLQKKRGSEGSRVGEKLTEPPHAGVKTCDV